MVQVSLAMRVSELLIVFLSLGERRFIVDRVVEQQKCSWLETLGSMTSVGR